MTNTSQRLACHLLRGGRVFSPVDQGQQDVLLVGGRIAAMAEHIDSHSVAALEPVIIDAGGHWLVPGLVDSLAHITGGGGEDGYASRTPELNISRAIEAGVTSMIGCLGTDATTRSLADLLAKARGLGEYGLSCWCHTGSYEVPVRTITGSIQDDLILIDRFIGVGEIAIADHRGAQPSVHELARLASEARRAGLLSGKAGIVSIHTGDGSDHFELINGVVSQTRIPRSQFYPTHVNRTEAVFQAGLDYAHLGGLVDFTTSTTPALIDQGEVPAAQAVKRMLDRGVPLEQITLSSDAQASLPAFDADGLLTGLEMADMRSLWQSVREGISEQAIEPAKMLATATLNPARILGLHNKGRLAVGMDADLLMIDPDTMAIDSVFGAGRLLMRNGELQVRGKFE